jgi:Ca2+-binding RTX toxin-like protein
VPGTTVTEGNTLIVSIAGYGTPGTECATGTSEIVLTDNVIDLGSGDDTLDVLFYGSWTGLTVTDNTFDGGDGVDVVNFFAFCDIDSVEVDLALATLVIENSAVNVLQNFENVIGSGGDDTIVGSTIANMLDGSDGNDALTGGDGNDTLVGGSGNDTLNGGQGMDTLTGGTGSDVLTGGADADNFVFGSGDSAAGPPFDEITDFTREQGDKINVSGIDAIDGGSGNLFTFIGADAFNGVAGELHYVAGIGQVTVEGDTNGDGAADFSITVLGVASLVAEDFIGP